jgi:hypothetical protein
MNRWLINPNAPATPGQKKTIKLILDSKKFTEYQFLTATGKVIDQLTMKQADIAIKKLSKIKTKPNGKNNK